MTVRVLLALAMLGRLMTLSGLLIASAHAQDERKPTAQEFAAIRACAAKYQNDEDEGERQCLFKLVAEPCTKMPANASTQATTYCYRLEGVIWDDLLNENFKNLAAVLDDEQAAKLRAMQRAWIAYRDTTCGFYWEKIHGTLAIPMEAECVARETARRALLLRAINLM
ncbi:MAG TPA: lysozyme inhibitor LprI family protein [Xanthobacteraceae bacterium]